jgi:hypothetical protein
MNNRSVSVKRLSVAFTMCLSVSLLVVLFASRASAQQICGFCSDSPEGGWSHTFGQNGALMACAPNTCHYDGPYFGVCSTYHYGCEPELLLGATEVSSTLKRLAAAVDQVDMRELAAITTSGPWTFVANTRMSSIDLTTCSGVVARIPATTAVVRFLEELIGPRKADVHEAGSGSGRS